MRQYEHVFLLHVDFVNVVNDLVDTLFEFLICTFNAMTGARRRSWYISRANTKHSFCEEALGLLQLEKPEVGNTRRYFLNENGCDESVTAPVECSAASKLRCPILSSLVSRLIIVISRVRDLIPRGAIPVVTMVVVMMLPWPVGRIPMLVFSPVTTMV